MGSDDDRTLSHDFQDPFVPARAGKYRIVGRIGQGGMGVVYCAVDDDLGRTVALKFLPAHLADNPSAEQRFLREARAASALDHVNIGAIFGIEDTSDHRRFIVMAFYDGQDLRQRLKDSLDPLTPDEAVSVAIQIARGLKEAHSRSVVHRDIKPSNILITTQGVVKIVDFGLASMAHGDHLTVSGAFLGTPAYMSPEQAQGKPADHRSDIWSLGVILLEMLTHEKVFQAESVTAVMFNIVHGELPLLEKVEQPLRRILAKALEKDPDKRYQCVDDFLSALEKITPGGEGVAGKVRMIGSIVSSPAMRSSAVWRRLQILIGGGLAVALLLFVPSVWRSRTGSGNRPAAAGAITSSSAFDKYLEGMELMKRWDKEGNIEQAIALFTGTIKQDPNFALGFARLADAQRIRYALTRENLWLEEATKNANEAARLNPELAPVHVVLGRIYAMKGNNDLAFASCERALRIDSNDPEAHQAIGRLYERLGRLNDAEASYRRAVSLDPASISIHDSYGNFLFRQGRHEDAIREWQTVMRLAPDHAAAPVNLGSALSETGRIAEAIAMYQKAVEIKPNYMAYTNLGTAYSRASRYNEAAIAYKKALELDDKDSMVWGNLAFVHSWLNGMDKHAKQTFFHAIQLAEAKRRQSPRDANVHSDLALYYAKMGQTELAIERLNTALALASKAPETQAVAAEVYELAGRRDKAIEFTRKALDLGYSRQRLLRNPELSGVMQSLPAN